MMHPKIYITKTCNSRMTNKIQDIFQNKTTNQEGVGGLAIEEEGPAGGAAAVFRSRGVCEAPGRVWRWGEPLAQRAQGWAQLAFANK